MSDALLVAYVQFNGPSFLFVVRDRFPNEASCVRLWLLECSEAEGDKVTAQQLSQWLGSWALNQWRTTDSLFRTFIDKEEPTETLRWLGNVCRQCQYGRSASSAATVACPECGVDASHLVYLPCTHHGRCVGCLRRSVIQSSTREQEGDRFFRFQCPECAEWHDVGALLQRWKEWHASLPFGGDPFGRMAVAPWVDKTVFVDCLANEASPCGRTMMA